VRITSVKLLKQTENCKNIFEGPGKL